MPPLGGKPKAHDMEADPECIVIDEALMYAAEHRGSAPKESIIRVLVSHFSIEEVNNAKGRLIGRLGEHINSEIKKNRKDSQNRTEKMKVCEDILDALQELEDKDINFVCVARQWHRMPKCKPEEVTGISMAEKLAEHEEKFKSYDEVLSELKIQVLSLMEKKNKPLLSEIVAGVNNSSSPRIDEVVGNEHCEPRTGDSLPSTSSTQKNKAAPAISESNMVIETSQKDTSSQDHRRNQSTSGFIFQRTEKRRQERLSNRMNRGPIRNQNDNRSAGTRMNPVVGKSQVQSGLRVTPSPDRDLFVYRVHKENTLEKLKDFITSRNVPVRNIERTSHNESKYNSFKLTVSADDIGRVLDPQFWPQGICVRRWKKERQNNNDNIFGIVTNENNYVETENSWN